jgi:4-carboxymuconolactone decarboxylase
MPEQQQATQNPPTFGRYAEIPSEQFSPKQKEAYDYILHERGVCPGPYRIWLQNPELLKAMTPIGVYYQKKLLISRQEHEIVTNCTNGKWATAAYSNKEREEIAEKADLPAEQVQPLIAVLPTSFEDPRQQVIYGENIETNPVAEMKKNTNLAPVLPIVSASSSTISRSSK